MINFLKNIINLLKRKPLLFLIIFIVIIFIVNFLINLLPKTSLPTQTVPNISPTTTLPSVLPVSNPKQPPFSIKWNNLSFKSPKSIDYYSYSPLVSPDTEANIVNSFDFSDQNLQKSTNSQVKGWKNSQRSLTLDYANNNLFYSSGIVPQSSSDLITEDKIIQTATDLVSRHLNISSESLILNEVVYFQRTNIYDTISSKENANVFQVSFNQKVIDHPLVSQSETGAPVTLYLDKKLNLLALVVKKAIISYVKQSSADIVNLDYLKTLPPSRFLRIDSAPDLDSSFKLSLASYHNLDLQKINLVYIVVDKYLLPVYLLNGTLISDTTGNQNSWYVTPAIK
jgi:hypothetical protein